MKHIDDSNLLLYSAHLVATDLGFTNKDLIDRARSLDAAFLLKPPAGMTIYSTITLNLYGHPFHSPPIRTKTFLTPSELSTTKLLCVTPTDAAQILKLQSIDIQEFTHAALLSKKQDKFFKITPKEFYRYVSHAAANRIITSQELDISDAITIDPTPELPPDTEMESTHFFAHGRHITIKFENLLIDKETLDKIINSIKTTSPTPEPDYGNFKPGNWTSPMLKHLNQASTLFIAPLPEAPDQDTIERTLNDIQAWLRKLWGGNVGGPLVRELSKAILPNKFSNHECNEKTRSIAKIKSENKSLLENLHTNQYTSDTLTCINIAALSLHNKPGEKLIKAETVSGILENKFDFRGRLTIAATTAIRTNSRTNKAISKLNLKPS